MARAPAAPALPPELAADPVLVAMHTELARAARGLQLPGYDAPYFVSFVVQDTEGYEVKAKQAALVASKPTRQRRAAVDVRIGSYALDNSDDPEPDWVGGDDELFEPSDIVPLEDPSPAGLQRALWLLTDFRYKQSLASYLKLKGQGVYKVDEPARAPSFSPAEVIVAADPVPALADPRATWEGLARRLSARLAAQPGMLDSEVTLEVAQATRWFVTTEGTRLRTSRTLYALHATGWTQAADGMILDASTDLYAPSADFAEEIRLTRSIDALAATLGALRDAPVLEPYTGPAIIETSATGVLFHEVLGHRLEGRRRDDDSDGQTFGRTFGQPILPPFLSLVDDPTLATIDGVPLNGHYAIDDEGVRSSRVTLVDHGVLKAFLSARRPGPGATHSNGHGRAEGIHRPVARQGNLVVEAHTHVDDAELKRQLITEAKRQGRPFGLIIRELAGGSTNTSSRGYQAFKGEARQVYKVDLETGRETLVRGVDLVGTPLILLSKIAAAGDHLGIFNGFCGAESGMVPVSAVAPSVLVREVELQRSNRPRARPPVLPPPPAARATTPTDSHGSEMGGSPR